MHSGSEGCCVDVDGGVRDDSPIRVLLVGGDDASGHVASDLAEAGGFAVRAVETVAAAEDVLDPEHVEAVVSASRLPDDDALAFLRRVRESDSDLPFVLLAPARSSPLVDEALAAGATDCLCGEEGATGELLARRLRTAVENRRSRDRIAHLERVNEVVRGVTSEVVGASTREGVERAICERIADSEPYLFSWVGVPDHERGVLEPRTWAGTDESYLDQVTVRVDDSPEGRGPGGRAARTHGVAVSQDVREDPAFEPWSEPATERGYRSTAAVPLVYEGDLYGVLNVYAERPRAFDQAELDLLAQLGETAGHAINAIETRERLREQQRELFEDAPVMYVRTRAEGGEAVVADCNGRFLETLGYEREAVVGHELAEFYTDASARALRSGGYRRTLESEFVREERELVTADGEVRETLLRAVPSYDADGEVVGSIAMFVDVTEQRRAQQVIEQATGMEAALDGMAVVAGTGQVVAVNDAFVSITGHEHREALLGRSWRECVDGPSAERIDDLNTEMRDGWRGEVTGQRADGSTFPAEISMAATDGGGFVVVVRDVSERERREAELERQNERLETFASVVSHDLRNPLYVASANLEMAMEGELDRLEAVESAHQRMDDLITDLLSLARQGRSVGERHPVDLETVVRDAWESVQTEGATLRVEETARFDADYERLREALANLLRNSVEHGGPDVTVRVGLLCDDRDGDGSGATDVDGFYVADDGPGVPSGAHGEIFEFGYSTGESGTGIGLAVVQTVVEAHGWSIESVAADGARFEVRSVDTSR